MGSTAPKIGNDLICYVKSTTKAYRFVTTVEGSGLPLHLEVDCDNDRAATLIALSMACELTTVGSLGWRETGLSSAVSERDAKSGRFRKMSTVLAHGKATH